jgi:hypothetical protein
MLLRGLRPAAACAHPAAAPVGALTAAARRLSSAAAGGVANSNDADGGGGCSADGSCAVAVQQPRGCTLLEQNSVASFDSHYPGADVASSRQGGQVVMRDNAAADVLHSELTDNPLFSATLGAGSEAAADSARVPAPAAGALAAGGGSSKAAGQLKLRCAPAASGLVAAHRGVTRAQHSAHDGGAGDDGVQALDVSAAHPQC